MKKQLLNVAAMLSLFIMLTAVFASAQTAQQLSVTIPFDFSVGKTRLPAGTYTIHRTSTNTADGFVMRDADGLVKVLFTTHAVQANVPAAPGRLEFRRFGSQYFLARFWPEGSDTGRELGEVSLEFGIAKVPSEVVSFTAERR